MRSAIFAVLLAFSLIAYARQKQESENRVVLPNSKLIGCETPACSQLWPDDVADSHATYPQNISIDIEDQGIIGVVTRYDKSTPLNDIRTSINKRYGEWVFPKDSAGLAVLWRVEPEKTAIQLAKDKDGTKEVIYLSARAWLRRHSTKAQ